MKTKRPLFLTALSAALLLIGCNTSGLTSLIPSSSPVESEQPSETSVVSEVSSEEDTEAWYEDNTPENPYGHLANFSKENEGLNAGDTLEFEVVPENDFIVDRVLVNDIPAAPVDGKKGFYNCVLEAGPNIIEYYFKIDPTVDFVEKFKLNIPDDTWTKVMDLTGLDSKTPSKEVHESHLDFRKDGVELMCTDYLKSQKKVPETFINFVDGDTTHVQTVNYGYTVKIRYLGIDTPESTSELEEWGKSASNFNKSRLSTAKWILLESQGWALSANYNSIEEAKADGVDFEATADGNQRSLAYVWYTDVENPTKSDFRCLNLEMVYAGYSPVNGSEDAFGSEFYKTFDKAYLSAVANKRARHSGEIDPDYCYDPPIDVQIKDLYDEFDPAKAEDTSTKYVDGKTLYRVTGYVSRKVDGAFYLQDKTSYKRKADGKLPEAYGLYVFTYAQTTIQPGDYVMLTGIFSIYSGCYQIQGISWHDFNPDPNRDVMILSHGNEVEPIEIESKEFSKNSFYNYVLVKMKDNLTCYNKTNSYGPASEGGTEEVNKYNTAYPFYNTDNKIIFWANGSSGDIRIVKDANINLTYGTEIARSWHFFAGGTNYYNPHGAELVVKFDLSGNMSYIPLEEQGDEAEYTIVTEYTTKILNGGCVFMSNNYVSTGGNQQYSLTIVSPADITLSAVAQAA